MSREEFTPPPYYAIKPVLKYQKVPLGKMPEATVLLVVSTRESVSAVLRHLGGVAVDNICLRTTFERETIVIGRIGAVCVAVLQVDPDEINATIACEEVLRYLPKVKVAISVGTAYGIRPGEQQIGDVLVASSLISAIGITCDSQFEEQELGTFAKDWNCAASQVFVGPLYSSVVLVDNAVYATELKQKHPTAIGGDVGSFAVALPAHRCGVRWLSIKGIADFGGLDAPKATHERSRELVAEIAMSFVWHSLIHGRVQDV